jgi:tetratricopeptide (TPR) repeat protein
MTPTPDTADWPRIKAVFDATIDLPVAQREPLILAAALAPAAVAELRSLLAHHDALEGRAGFMVDSAAMALVGSAARVGQRLGDWEIVRAIGSGGMGEVFEARRADGQYEGRAAVKLLKRGMDSAAVLQRFALERQALARLNHPHIARLLDAGASEDGLPYFVLEFVDGQPIDEAARPLSLEQRLTLFLQLADAVAHAHRNLLVHRDLKPGNVLVDTQGQVKLLDFGIAKALDPLESLHGEGDSQHTAGGVRPFTPHYASPEQVRGEPVTTATDIYSLGVLLYVMLTGQRPYGRKAVTPAEAVRSVLEEEPTRPSSLAQPHAGWEATRRKLRGDLDNILLKTLEKQAEARYAGVDALAADLKAFLEGRPVSARTASPGYVLGKFLRRHRSAALAAALGGLGLLTGLAATLVQGHVALALGALGLSAGLVMALAQARRAQRARDDAAQSRDEAQRHLVEMRRLANTMVFDVNDALERGTTEGRRQLVRAAAQSLEKQLAFSALNDVERIELAQAISRLAKLEGHAYADNIGDRAAALVHYQQALHLLEPLAPRHENNAEWHGAMVSALEGLSSLQRASGQRELGLASMQRVSVHAARAAALKPDDMRWRAFECAALIELSTHNYHVGRDHGLNRLGPALAHIQDALACSQRLVDFAPQHPRAWKLRTLALRNYGGLLSISGRLVEAVQVQRDSLAALERAISLPGGDLQRMLYAASLQHLGMALDQIGEVDEAAALFASGVALTHADLTADPTNERLQMEYLLQVANALNTDLRRSAFDTFDAVLGQALACMKAHRLEDMDAISQRHLIYVLGYGVVADAHRARGPEAAAGMERLREALRRSGLQLNAAEPNDAEVLVVVDTAEAWCEALHGRHAAAQQAAARVQGWVQRVYEGRAPEDMFEHLAAVESLVRLARAPIEDSDEGRARRASIVAQARRFDAPLIDRGLLRPDQRIESRWLTQQA